jgi:ArsR family transcriptional regulator
MDRELFIDISRSKAVSSPGMDRGTSMKELPVLDAPVCCAPVVSPSMTQADARGAAALFKALADPHRVRIVNLLATADEPVCVCDLQAPLGLAQGTVSFHLKRLLDAGLIRRERRGTWSYYSLERDALGRVAAVLEPTGGGSA